MSKCADQLTLLLSLCLGLAAAAPDACTGMSSNLAAAECTGWVSLYDGTGGATSWTGCRANRLDPCACRFKKSGVAYTACSVDGQHILTL